MELFSILLAFCLPGILGVAWLNLLVPRVAVARRPILGGHGILLGLILIPLLMRLLDTLGVGLSFPWTAAVSVVLILSAGLVYIRRPDKGYIATVPDTGFVSLSGWQQILFLLVFLLLVTHVVMPGVELLGRPLYPFDATMHWATKARVWFEAGEIVPFVDNAQWLSMRGTGVYTDHHADYPVTIPLLQVWMSSAVGRWDESLMNLPWVLCLVGLGMAFYGQLRSAGIGALMSIVFVYLLLSMPLINTHVALAGYADLILGACYCAALMAFHNWTTSREPWQAVMSVLFAISCVLVKNEGLYWLLTFIPALIVVLLPGRRAAAVLVAILLVLLALLVFFPRDFAVAGHSMDYLRLGYRPEALTGIAKSFWVHGSWHLFAYLLTAVLLVGFALPGINISRYRGLITALTAALILFLFLFTSTRYAIGAIKFTAVSRISLQLVPGLLFLSALIIHAIVSRDDVPSDSIAATT